MGPGSGTIELLDTTLRDGEQTQGVSFAPQEKVSIAKALLQSLRVDRIEVASARISQGEKDAVTHIHEWAADSDYLDRVEVLGFTDHTRSVDWIRETGGRVMNLLAKGSEKHCREQLRKTLAGHLADVRRTVDYALSHGLLVNLYLEDWSNGYADSPRYVFDLVEAMRDTGIRHVMLPDTLGVMSPDEVYASIGDMVARFPRVLFDFHPHNDYGLATANTLMAAKAGASTIHCTVNCLGERAGNASLAEVAVALHDKLGLELAIDESKIHALSEMVERFSGKRVADNTPIVGADVFTQTSGIHADGDNKGRLYQTALGPERFERTRHYALGKMSGKASLVKNMEAMGISLSEEVRAKVLAQIVKLGDQKAQITPEDLPFIIADILESKDYSHIELLNCSITSGLDLESTASIRIRLDGTTYQSSGNGNGGFDAFIAAIRKTLDRQGFQFPELVDFEVRIPPGGRTSALTECFITWDDGGQKMKTRGVNSNQVFAAVQATLRMLNVKLHRLRAESNDAAQASAPGEDGAAVLAPAGSGGAR